MGRGKGKERPPHFPSSHRPPRAFYFSIVATFIGIPTVHYRYITMTTRFMDTRQKQKQKQKQRFHFKQSLRLKYAMIKLKPGFHMIATIAVIAAIAEKKKTSAIAATTITEIQKVLSQRSLSLRSLESGFHMIAELFFLSNRSYHSDRSNHMETGLNLSQ